MRFEATEAQQTLKEYLGFLAPVFLGILWEHYVEAYEDVQFFFENLGNLYGSPHEKVYDCLPEPIGAYSAPALV